MRVVPSTLLLILALAMAAPPPARCNPERDTNVNSRYTVESVELSPRVEKRISTSLRGDIQSLVGGNYDEAAVDRLAKQMKKELSGYRVQPRIAKGSKPDSVKVVFETVRVKRDQDLTLPRLAYHSKQNFSFGADIDLDHGDHQVRAGLITDNDQLLERFSGIRGSYRRLAAGGRLRVGVNLASYRAQWNGAIQTALAAPENSTPGSATPGSAAIPGIYRTRSLAEPELHVEVLPGVWLGAGISIQRLQTQFPAARQEGSHSLISSLRLERRWDHSVFNHRVEAGYSLRAATSFLDSDFLYTRHLIDARYIFRTGKDQITASFLGGTLSGRAPLFERFLLGNSTTLRGYNKYDVAPLGGNRVAHGSIDYRHKPFRVIYDTGTVYQSGGRSRVLHSIAAGITTGFKGESFSFLVAFPLREGRAEPIFLLGMNF